MGVLIFKYFLKQYFDIAKAYEFRVVKQTKIIIWDDFR